jgi:hypothetical protein
MPLSAVTITHQAKDSNCASKVKAKLICDVAVMVPVVPGLLYGECAHVLEGYKPYRMLK